MAQRNITDAVVIASQTQHGIAHAQCIEAVFGARVTVSIISVEYVGHRSGFRLETSIDYGRTWQEVRGNDQEIPGLLPGTSVVHLEVFTRVLFLDHQDTVLIKQILTTVVLDSNDTITRIESGATLGSGSLEGCKYDPMRNGLAAIPELSVDFAPTATDSIATAWYPPAHGGDERPQGLHISHGRPITFVPQEQGGAHVALEGQDIDHPDHLADASCTIEMWVYPTLYRSGSPLVQQHHTLLSWMVDDDGAGNGPNGCAIQLWPSLDPDDLTAAPVEAIVRFVKYGYIFKTEDLFVLSTAVVPLNKWTRIAMLYDGFRARLVINGAVSNTVAFHADTKEVVNGREPDFDTYGVVIPTTGKFIIGNDIHPDSDRPGQYWGRMSELRLYNREVSLGTAYLKSRRRLSQVEIDTLKATDGLVEYWPLNDGSGKAAVGKILGAELVFSNMGLFDGANWVASYDTFLGRPYEVTLASGTRADVPYAGETPPAGLGDLQTVVIGISYAPARLSPPMIVEAKTNNIKITNAPFDVVFPDGRVFQGVGQYSGIDAIQEPTEIGPTGINVSLTALDESLVGLAMQAIYMDGSLKVYEVYFDLNDKLVQDPILIFGGLMDAINIRGGKEPTVVVSAESQLRNWQRSSVIKWNNEGHRSRYPHDAGLEFVARTVDQQVWWPAKTTVNIP